MTDHLRRTVQAQVLSIPGLSRDETAGMQGMISGIKRDCATTLQVSNGKTVQCLTPTLLHEPLMSEGKPLGCRTVTWICLPYFTLEPYSGLAGASKQKGFPALTLLQTKYLRTTRSRDMQQAVCQQKDVASGLCFYVSQLWCLILDNCTQSRPPEPLPRNADPLQHCSSHTAASPRKPSLKISLQRLSSPCQCSQARYRPRDCLCDTRR